MDEQSFFFELGESHFAQTGEQGLEGKEEGTRWRIEKNKDLDIAGGERLAMEAGGGRAPMA